MLALHAAALLQNERRGFGRVHWTWRSDEQWAVLGNEGSGRSLLIDGLLGLAPLREGELRGTVFDQDEDQPPRGDPIALVSPRTQRQVAEQESSFYQSRWHSGLQEGERTVSQFLSFASVNGHIPFQVDAPRGDERQFARRRLEFSHSLGVDKLFRRRLVCLSNGELRRTLLVHALLQSPRLLILDDAYAGLDLATRGLLRRLIDRLMAEGARVLVSTSRLEDLPAAASHLLLVRDHRIEAQGARAKMLRIWRERLDGGRLPSSRLGSWGPPAGRRARVPTDAPLVELRQVSITIARRRILKDVTWIVREGERWALLGPNGAGKTTLLNLIQGDHPQAYACDLRLFGRAIDGTRTLWEMRQRLAWMSPELHQHYPGGWTALEVVCSGYFHSIGLYQACSRARRREALRRLKALGLAACVGADFGDLSFGQQRLVLFARAIVKRPRLLILDEPCQGLDSDQRSVLLAGVDRVAAESGCSIIFVTHRPHEMPACISRFLELTAGRVSRTE